MLQIRVLTRTDALAFSSLVPIILFKREDLPWPVFPIAINIMGPAPSMICDCSVFRTSCVIKCGAAMAVLALVIGIGKKLEPLPL